MSSSIEAPRRKPELRSHAAPITSIDELLGHPVAEPKNKKSKLKPTGIGSSPVLVICEDRQLMSVDGSIRTFDQIFTLVINDPLFGKRQNQIYWETAPSDSFGLDLNDIKNDHTRLLTKNPAYERQLKMHESLGKPWKVFRRFGPGELQAVAYQKPDTAPLIPIIRWTNVDGVRKFIYSNILHTQTGKNEVRNFLGENVPDSPLWENVLDPSLGICTLAMVSPEQRRHWPKKHGIHGQGSMTMGSTQALLLSMVMEGDLTNAPLLENAEVHSATNGSAQSSYLLK